MSDQQMQQQGSIQPASPVISADAGEMSDRGYVGLIALLITLGFAVVAAGGIAFSDPGFLSAVGVLASPATLIVSIIVCIGGIIVQWQAQKRKNASLALLGFAMISVPLGGLSAMTLQLYDIGTITAAFVGMVVMAVAFGVLGYMYPAFFAKAQRTLLLLLVVVVIVEVVLLITGIDQGITDWAVLAIFCGLIAFDLYARCTCRARS